MARALVSNLAETGVISDVAPFALPPNAWTEARNVSFEFGGVTKSGNRMEIMVPTTVEVKKIYPKGEKIYYTSQDTIWEATGTHNTALKTGFAPPSPNGEWIITELSNVIVFSNDTNNPVYLPPGGSTISELPKWGYESGAQHNWKCAGIRAYKNFLVAWGMVEDSSENLKQRIRWSDIALPGQPPGTWDASDATKNAGFVDLSEARGEITDVAQMGEFLFIYTTKEVFRMTYTGGAEIFRFQKVFDDISILGVETVAAVTGGHFLVTNTDIVMHNGQSWQSIIDNKIKKDLFQKISNGEPRLVKAIHYPAKQEVWVLYAASSTKYRDHAAIYNLLNGTWTYRELPRVTAIAYGIIPNTDNKIIDEQDYVFDSPEADVIINGVGQDFNKGSLFIAEDSLKWWAVDESLDGTENLPCSMTKFNIDFDEYGIDADVPVMVNSVFPQINGYGDIWISIGVSDDPYSMPKWQEAKRFTVNESRKVDFRCTGRYISIKFEGFEKDQWTLMSYAIDITPRWPAGRGR